MNNFAVRRSKDHQWFCADGKLMLFASEHKAVIAMRQLGHSDDMDIVDIERCTLPEGLEVNSPDDPKFVESCKDTRPLDGIKVTPKDFDVEKIIDKNSKPSKDVPDILSGLNAAIEKVAPGAAIEMGEDDGPWVIERSNGEDSDVWCGDTETPQVIPSKRLAEMIAKKMNKSDPDYHYAVIRPPNSNTMDDILGELS